MTSGKHETLWQAEPHTLAKIEILKGYLNAYFPILGRSKRGQNILLVDGFAGPGEYTNASEGSPVVALRTATAALSSLGTAWIAEAVHCIFIEPDKDACGHLRERLEKVQVHRSVKKLVIEKTFVNGIAEVQQKFPRPFTTADPLFVFIDPFGATGVPFENVAAVLGTPCSEVLINLDSDGIARNFMVAAGEARDKLLTTIFGDESWRQALTTADFKTLCQQVLGLYKQKLRAIRGVEYVFSFEMRGRKDTLNYHLVFASQNPLGLEKMKEAMRRIDNSGSYTFSDGHVNQITMFRFDHPEDFAPKLHQQFIGHEVAYLPVATFALNETPFTNPIQMLRVLHERRQIEVTRYDPKTKGFSGEHVRTIKFLIASQPQQGRSRGPQQGGLFDGN